MDRSHDRHRLEGDLHDRSVELAPDQQVRAIRREVQVVGSVARHRERLDQPPRVRIHEVQTVGVLRHIDRLRPVGSEVQVVRVFDPVDDPDQLARAGIDHRQFVRPVHVDVEPAHVPRRGDVLGERSIAQVDPPHDAEGLRIDHLDRPRQAVRHVDEGRVDHHGWSQPLRIDRGVDVAAASVRGRPTVAPRRGRSGLGA